LMQIGRSVRMKGGGELVKSVAQISNFQSAEGTRFKACLNFEAAAE
jgi:hypothetical protein